MPYRTLPPPETPHRHRWVKRYVFIDIGMAKIQIWKCRVCDHYAAWWETILIDLGYYDQSDG